MGVMMLMFAIGVGAWALGRTQTDGGPGPGGGGGGGAGVPPHGDARSNTQSSGYAGGPAPGQGPTSSGGPAAGERPKSSWQRPNPSPGSAGSYTANGAANGTANGAAKGAWERAREETKKKEEERKAKEAEKKRKEDLEKRLKEAREKEAREREAREMLAREREKEARERAARERAARDMGQEPYSKGSTYAYSAMGEKTNPWPRSQPASPAASPTKKPPAPTAKTYLGTDEETFSYRPYDSPPKKPVHKKSPSSIYSESSYAASQSTARTTPPPSHRGPYSTKDPDKIVIKAVYSFNNAFIKTPTSQLVSGVGSVTDGLILRITTEGLFIDDDVRGVPQREWDVKAWTMKLVEVWCPSFSQGPAGNSASARVAFHASPPKHNPVRRLWGLDKAKAASSEETDALLADMLHICRDNCHSARAAAPSSASSAYSASSASTFDDRSSVTSDSAYGSSVGSPSPRKKRTNGVSSQTGELKSVGLHVLRASIRDQEGKKYLFVIGDEESWKIPTGLQRLRKGSQVRALGVSGMSISDARGTLENLGWA